MRIGAWIAALTLAVVALAGTARAEGLFELEWTKLAEGVWAGNRHDALRYPVVCNTVIVTGEDGALIFDGGGFIAQGEQVLAQLKAVTDKPLRYIVISHWHGDHHRGIAPLIAAFPDVRIVAQEFTRAAILGALMQTIDKREHDGGTKEDVAAVKEALASGKFFDGSPFAPDERGYWDRFVKDGDLHAAEVLRMRLTPPDITFDDRMRIYLGDRVIELLFLGKGNTKGDAMMYLPAEKILATGDVVVAPVPYAFNAYPESWIGVLKRIEAMDIDVLVPGHGAFQRDKAYVALMIDALETVRRQVGPLAAEGKTAAEIYPQIDYSAVEPRFTNGDAVAARLFEMFFKHPVVAAELNVLRGIDGEKLTADPPPEGAAKGG